MVLTDYNELKPTNDSMSYISSYLPKVISDRLFKIKLNKKNLISIINKYEQTDTIIYLNFKQSYI